uniref:Acetyltransferase n=1 Tax=viral metagenome TaxID=1070528 RepID=A0A6H1ZAS2_9ZZZZ
MIIKKMDIETSKNNKGKILELFNKYYGRIGYDIIGATELFESVIERLNNGNMLFLTWGDYEGFLTCDWKTNPIKKRKEGVIWTVYNPDPKYKAKVLSMIESEANQKGIDAIVFFAEKPLLFNKIVEDFGYNMTLGYFEKQLKEGVK